MPFNILLVDDHKIMRDGIKAILARGLESGEVVVTDATSPLHSGSKVNPTDNDD